MAQPETISNDSQRLVWYQNAKFGLFIHWGAYAVAGVEASWPIMAPDLSAAMFGTQATIREAEYRQLPNRFNPVDFDPEAWVALAQQAGMRYIVITAKHHDGFCMFDAPGTDYKITHTPYGKDLCLELAQACARAGMPLGFYYSPPDMHHPGYRDTRRPATKNWTGEPKRKDWDQYLDYMESHLRKLLTDYGKVAVLWFDGLTNHGKYDPPRFHQLIHELSPNTLINDRLGAGFDFITPEQFIPKAGIPAQTGKPPSGIDPGGDSFFNLVTFLFKIPGIRGWIRQQMGRYADGTLELTPVHQEPYPAPQRFQPWETCMTMGQSWAHNPHETHWKTPAELLHNLVAVVSRGGNYLLNVGPTAQGTFPPEAVERLQHIGEWMKLNAEALYGSTYTPLQGLPWGQATRKDDQLYLHIFAWPANGLLEIKDFPGRVEQITLLSGAPLTYQQQAAQLTIHLPPQAPDPDVSVLAVKIDSSEQGWNNYSPAVETKISPKIYLQKQVIASAWINALLNGLIAFFSYRTRAAIPSSEAAVDVLITVAIIAFLVSWISIGSARSQIIKGNLTQPAKLRRSLKLPQGAAWRALVITIACVVLFGGLLDVAIYLFAPGGFGNWAYVVLKTLYTGGAAALAAALAIQSVVTDGDSW